MAVIAEIHFQIKATVNIAKKRKDLKGVQRTGLSGAGREKNCLPPIFLRVYKVFLIDLFV